VKILVAGGGGREHALCWALARTATILCAPGNPGTALHGTNVPVDPSDHDALVRLIKDEGIDLTVIGPEAPLASGLVDRITAAGHRAFGPTAAAARIEASKAYAKDTMAAAGVPTASSRSFTDEPAVLEYIASHGEPVVVKASGLAAGKGVIICETRSEAAEVARGMLRGSFGDAGRQVVVEEHLAGEELSVLGITDGEQVMLLPASQDHKRLRDGDEGPNTGGMGAYTPVSSADDEMLRRVLRDVYGPTLWYLASQGAPYRGVLYAGLMIGDDGTPRVLEFNCRFGDPEAQVVLPSCDVALEEHLWSIASGEAWRPQHTTLVPRHAAVTTVLAAPGYPQAPSTGAEIRIPKDLPGQTLLFHAGTARDSSGTLRTAGGRVLCATGLGRDVPEAAQRSQALAQMIEFDGKVYRRDIAWREIARAGAA
jgi:phosphoribosylamine--glycine ligase